MSKYRVLWSRECVMVSQAGVDEEHEEGVWVNSMAASSLSAAGASVKAGRMHTGEKLSQRGNKAINV